MRRSVRGRIADALERAGPALEEYIGPCLEYPFGFPYNLAPAAVLIREVRSFKVVPLARADLPPVKVEVQIKAWLFSTVNGIQEGWAPGVLDADIELMIGATAGSDGAYRLTPQSATLKAWWRDMAHREGER